MDKVGFIIDGGWFTKKFCRTMKRFPSADDTEKYINYIFSILNDKYLADESRIYRIFYYDCKPINAKLQNPVTGKSIDLGATNSFKNNQKLQSGLTQKNFFAVRLGNLDLIQSNKNPWASWKVKSRSMGNLVSAYLAGTDIEPNVSQKGVDMKIGLDIASISAKKLCSMIVLIAGDTDMIPAMKTARKEGIQICLHSFDSNPNFTLGEHSDVIMRHKEVVNHAQKMKDPL